MTVEMLDHLNMTVRSVDESTEWYGRVFGFESVEEGDWGGRPWRILKSGEAMLCIYETPDRDHPSIEVHDHHAIKHFAFRIKDRERWAQTIEREGLRLYYGGAIDYPHSRSWYVHDPNGYEIEVAAWDAGRAAFD
jgi:catechol-2,3-dioxygenase